MKITIEAAPKEIAALVLEIQERLGDTSLATIAQATDYWYRKDIAQQGLCKKCEAKYWDVTSGCLRCSGALKTNQTAESTNPPS